jgi:hypothetical protein
LIVPLNPFWLDTVTVEVLDEPWRNASEAGFEDTEKLGVGGACTTKSPTMLG